MGTSTREGLQTIHPDFEGELTQKALSKYLSEVLPAGIYDGGVASIIDSDTVEVSPWVILIRDGSNHLVKSKTEETIELEPVPSEPWIVLQFTQKNQEDWWAEPKVLSAKTDALIVFGKAEFDSNNNLSSIDTSERSRPYWTNHTEFDGIKNHKELVELNTEVDNGGTYNVEKTDYILDVDTSGSNKTVVRLPDLANTREGRVIIIKDAAGNASSENIDVTTATPDSVEGTATKTINTDYGSLKVRASKATFNSNEWLVTE